MDDEGSKKYDEVELWGICVYVIPSPWTNVKIGEKFATKILYPSDFNETVLICWNEKV